MINAMYFELNCSAKSIAPTIEGMKKKIIVPNNKLAPLDIHSVLMILNCNNKKKRARPIMLPATGMCNVS